MGRATFLAVAAAVCVVTACAGGSAPRPALERPGPTADAPRIVIVQSTKSAVFSAPVKAFMAQAGAAITLFDEVPSDESLLVDAIRARNPALVVTLGTKATVLATKALADTPVLFTMVVNHRRLGLEERPNVMGIALESSTTSEFSQFKLVLPTLRRVLAFYVRKESAMLIEAARAELAPLGVELVAVEVASRADVKARYAASADTVDGVWFLNDPVLMNKQTFEFLRVSCARDRIPLFASLSDEFARRGALMSVSTDLTSLGAQAAAMVRMHLEQNRSAKDIGVQPPISTKLVVNMQVARALGVELLDDTLPFIDELIDNNQVAKP